MMQKNRKITKNKISGAISVICLILTIAISAITTSESAIAAKSTKNKFLSEKFWQNATPSSVKKQISKKNDINQKYIPKKRGGISQQLNDGVALDNLDKRGWTGIMFAAAYAKNAKAVTQAIKTGANLKAKNRTGTTALMIAAVYNNPSIIKALAEKGINQQDEEGYSALMYAAQKNPDEKAIKVLLKAGANINAVNNIRATALLLSATNENNAVLKTLLDSGADVKIKRGDGTTVLMIVALFSGNSESIKWLLKKGVDVNAKTNEGWTALMYATRSNDNYQAVKELLKKGADVNAKTESGYTALKLAISNNSEKSIKMLKKAGAKN